MQKMTVSENNEHLLRLDVICDRCGAAMRRMRPVAMRPDEAEKGMPPFPSGAFLAVLAECTNCKKAAFVTCH